MICLCQEPFSFFFSLTADFSLGVSPCIGRSRFCIFHLYFSVSDLVFEAVDSVLRFVQVSGLY